MTLKVLYEDDHTLVALEPQGMPVQKDVTRNRDLLSETEFMLKINGRLPMNQSLHLINRLDRPVGGLVLFAKSSLAAGYYSDLIKKKALDKHYLTVVMGTPLSESAHLVDYLIKDAGENRSSVADRRTGKPAGLEFRMIESRHNRSLLEIRLITGRHHQIRVQLSHSGLPIWGDAKYNPDSSNDSPIALWACELAFIPYGQKKAVTIQSKPSQADDPWNRFTKFKGSSTSL